MTQDNLSIDVNWDGPFAWSKYEKISGLPPIPKHPGVYLQTVEYNDGYLIYAAGITRRTIHTRFREHTKKYLNGDYTVLDIVAMQQGKRVEIWHGWGWNPEKRAKFDDDKVEITEAVHKQLTGFRVFVANLGTEPRILERFEASVMNNLYKQPSPYCDIPDRGMHLAPRKKLEEPISAKFKCLEILYGLPDEFEI